jgi:hypothetical protein
MLCTAAWGEGKAPTHGWGRERRPLMVGGELGKGKAPTHGSCWSPSCFPDTLEAGSLSLLSRD